MTGQMTEKDIEYISSPENMFIFDFNMLWTSGDYWERTTENQKIREDKLRELFQLTFINMQKHIDIMHIANISLKKENEQLKTEKTDWMNKAIRFGDAMILNAKHIEDLKKEVEHWRWLYSDKQPENITQDNLKENKNERK